MAEREATVSEITTASNTEMLSFNVGDATYAIEIKYIKEIIEVEQITLVPKIPSHIKGVINLRGKVVPVISIRKRFEIEEIPFDSRTCIIVLEFEDGEQVGIIVDRVQEVVDVKSSDISQTPDSKNVNANRYIKSIVHFENNVKWQIEN